MNGLYWCILKGVKEMETNKGWFIVLHIHKVNDVLVLVKTLPLGNNICELLSGTWNIYSMQDVDGSLLKKLGLHKICGNMVGCF